MNTQITIKLVKEIRDIETDTLTGYLVDGMTVPLAEGNRHYMEVQEWLKTNTAQLAYTKAERDAYLLKQAITAWKQDRQTKIDAIEVTYKGVVYQGDETSQNRMTKAITALPDNTTTVPWTAKDNTIQNLTKIDLQAILLDAGTQQSVLWNKGRPV